MTSQPAREPLSAEAASPGYWAIVWGQFRRNRQAMLGLGMVGLFFFLAFFAPFLGHRLPIVWRTAAGSLRFPLINEFFAPMNTTEVVLELAFNFLLLYIPLAFVTWRLVPRFWPDVDRRASRRVALAVGAVLAAGFVAAVAGVLAATEAYKLWYEPAWRTAAVMLTAIVLLGLTGLTTVILMAANQTEASPRWLVVLAMGLVVLIPFGAYKVVGAVDAVAGTRLLRGRVGQWVFRPVNDPTPYRELAQAGKGGGLFPLIPYGPNEQISGEKLSPSWWTDVLEPAGARRAVHLLGTDEVGRDILVRVIHGARVSLSVGFVSMAISTLIGLVLGATAAYFGGKTDILLSRLIEIMMSFPTFFLILTIIAILDKRSILNIMLVIGFTRWTGIARLVRGQVLQQKQQDYVPAAQALGAPDVRVIFRHLLPNSVAPVLVAVSFGIATAILTEAGLSFLGFGVAPPTPTWGQLLNQGRQAPLIYWWLVLFPGFLIFLGVFAYNMVGDGLRDAMDPRLRQ